jgi:sulfhydrogenase subunit beta (sulfur reductase)
MTHAYVSKQDLLAVLGALQDEYAVLVPVNRDGRRYYTPYSSLPRPDANGSDGLSLAVGEVRAFEPLKAFYFRARQKVAENFAAGPPATTAKPLCLVGVKACDLKGFKVLDSVFVGGEYQDPLYKGAREDSLIISADCTTTLEVCFCLALEVEPHPTELFDLNLSEVSGGFVVEAGTDKGERILAANAARLQEAPPEALRERQEQRDRVKEEVENNIREYGVPRQGQLAGVIRRNFESPLWQEEAATCVECGACNTICPTCHCFQLFDQLADENLARYRLWDSCLIKDFAKVAGGANPRPHLWMRLRNRFEKKFDFFPAVEGIYACTGCGRCILACPGKIDIRKVLERNVGNG